MTSPFRSTLGVAARRRLRPAVERSSFVLVQIGDMCLAVAAEQVERVLRCTNSAKLRQEVSFGDHTLPVLSLHSILSCDSDHSRMRQLDASDSVTERRVLVVRTPHQSESSLALQVDAVHEVFAVETTLVRPLSETDGAPYPHTALRGRFQRGDGVVWVIDAARLVGRRS